MNQEEKNGIVNILKNLEAINIREFLINFYKSKDTDFNSKIVLGNYTVSGLVNAIDRLKYNFSIELNSTGWSSLPAHVQHHELGTRHLQSDLQNLYNQISTKEIDVNFITYLDWLIYYQRVNHFWNLSKEVIDVQKISELKNDLNAKKEFYTKYILDIDTLKKDIETHRTELLKLIADKTKEFELLSGNASNSQNLLAEITQVLSDGKNKGDRLVEIVKYSEEKSDEAKNRIEEERKKFEEYKKTQEELVKTLNTKVEEVDSSKNTWDEKLKAISEVESYIKQKTDEINNLTGFSAGVSLFHTFQERKKELQKSVTFWQWSIAAIAVLVIVYISILFYVNPSTTINGTSWGIFALNSIKSIPGIILLYFVIRQYNKERTFQEEYAFKSSVSLTVNAFADKLSNERESKKDDLIKESVSRIYETPHSMKEKSGILFSFRTRTLNDTVKNLTDAVKEIKK